MEKRFTVTVVVPAYNAEATIEACLQALVAQQISADIVTYEIVLVNDASTDRTAAIAAQFQAVRVIDQPINQGRSAARNAGVLAATGEIILFTDADCEPTSDWVVNMVRPFQQDAAVVGVKGAYYSRQRAPVARFTQLELEEKYGELARRTTIAFIDTYAAAYRRAIFLENGGFDQTLSYSLLEDQDFSFRLAAQGHKMVFAPSARVYHHHVTNGWRYYRRKWMIGKWKNVIWRRYPERRRDDSRTPASLKLQFGLALLLSLLLPLFAFRPIRKLLTPFLLSFIATTIPFLIQAARHDPNLLPFVLPLLLLRAFGLAHGYIDGFLRLRMIR